MKIEVKKLENSEVEITGSVPFEKLVENRKKGIENIAKGVKIDGFREGKVPEKILIEKVGEMTILNEMAELTLQKNYPEIIISNKIDPITSPQITITKLAPENPLEFTIKVAVMPKFDIADYKKIAQKENSKKEEGFEATDEEVENTIKQILASQNQHSCEDEKCEHEKEIPKEMTDEMVKKFGDYKNVDDFKIKLKENIKTEKEHRAKEKKRLEILDAVLKEMKIELPEVLVDAELRKMMAEMSDNISRMGLKFDKYLEHIKKTEDDLKKEWRADAENRVKGQLTLNRIASEEKIEPNEDEVKKNTDVLMSQYKDAKRENVEIYVKMMLVNEEVFKLLESLQ